MPEILVNRSPAPTELRRRIRQNIGRLEPGLRVVADDLLGQVSRIDLVGRAEDGAAVVVLISGEPAEDGLLTRGLAQRAWLAPRLSDWLKLNPDLAIDPAQPVRLLLIAPHFGPELCAAAFDLTPGVVRLATCRYVQTENHRSVLLELVPAAAPTAPEPREEASEDTGPPLPPFRSGLADADLIASVEAPSAKTGRY